MYYFEQEMGYSHFLNYQTLQKKKSIAMGAILFTGIIKRFETEGQQWYNTYQVLS